jgi:uncharacterized protein (TIGR00369 family)
LHDLYPLEELVGYRGRDSTHCIAIIRSMRTQFRAVAYTRSIGARWRNARIKPDRMPAISSEPELIVDIAAANAVFARVLAPWVKDLGLIVEAVSPEQTTLRLPESSRFVHAGGVVCGQTLMAAADTAMVVAFSAALGGFRPMTTVNMNTTFLRPVGKGDMRVIARVVRCGKTLLYGDVDIVSADGKVAAHATTTYALL